MKKKKAKGTKKCVIKRKPKSQDYKDCLRAAKVERKINCLEKRIKINADTLKGNQKEFVKKK